MPIKESQVLFRTSTEIKNKFSACVILQGKSNKAVFEKFMLKFINQPEQTLQFIGY